MDEEILGGLADPDYRIRMRTIHALVEQRAIETVPLILPLLRDRERLVRCAAIVALGELGDRQAFEFLVPFLAASTSLERKHAVNAIIALGDQRMLDPFLQALKTQPSIRAEIIKVISVFPEKKVLDALIERLVDRDEHVRAVAAIALGRKGQPEAIPALQQMALTDTNEEDLIQGLWTRNSSIAERAIRMILYPDQEEDVGWPG